EGTAIAADAAGEVFVTGTTLSSDFPVSRGAVQTKLALFNNAFVAVYDRQGRRRWATYLSISGGDDDGTGIVAAGPGAAYLTGSTLVPDIPVTSPWFVSPWFVPGPGAAQSIYGGGDNDAFVARLVVPASRPTALDPTSPPPAGASH